MIRINLLGRPRPRVKRRVPIAGTLQLALFLIPIVLAVVALGYHYSLISSELNDYEREIAQQQIIKQRLAQLEKEIREFQQKQEALQRRINVIEELRQGQKGPVALLDAIGETVNRTETLWLTKLEEKGTNITLEGMAGSINAVANFITELRASGYFRNIEIKEAVQSTESPGVENYKFSLSCDFVLPQTQQPTTSPGGA